MNDPIAQMDAYLAALNAAGVRAVIDAADINPPAVQMRAPTFHYRFGRGCIAADWTARLILPNNGQRNAFVAAVPLLEMIHDALSGIVVTATPVDYDLPDGGGPVPGYELSWSTR